MKIDLTSKQKHVFNQYFGQIQALQAQVNQLADMVLESHGIDTSGPVKATYDDGSLVIEDGDTSTTAARDDG